MSRRDELRAQTTNRRPMIEYSIGWPTSSRAFAALILVPLALAACGGKSSEDKAKEQQAIRHQDTAAKANVRNGVSDMEVCFTDVQDYAQCKPTQRGVTVSGASTTGYTLTATSASGNKFTVKRKSDGNVSRSCATAGKGGCQPGGKW